MSDSEWKMVMITFEAVSANWLDIMGTWLVGHNGTRWLDTKVCG